MLCTTATPGGAVSILGSRSPTPARLFELQTVRSSVPQSYSPTSSISSARGSHMASGFRVAAQTAYTAISSESPGHVCGNAGNRKDSGALEGGREGKPGSIRTRQFCRAVRNNDQYDACHPGWTQQHLPSRRTRHRKIPSHDSLSVNANKPQAKTGPGSL